MDRLMDVEGRLARVEAAVADADVELCTVIGGHNEKTVARLWRGQVLVDWEPDPQAGGCLLRPGLLRRLVALHARVEEHDELVRIVAPGRIVAALSDEHAELVSRLGGTGKVELRALLRFEAHTYRGGQETYFVVERGRRLPLLRLAANVRPRAANRAPTRVSQPGLPNSLPART